MASIGGSNAVRSGLVLSLDAANARSYVSGSTTWRDLSGNGNNFTLFNSVGFNTQNGGALTFNGTNQYAASTNNINLTSYSYVAVEVFYRSNVTTGGPLLFEHTANWNANTGGFGLAINSNGNGDQNNMNHTNHKTGVGANIARNYLVTDNAIWSNNLNLFSRISDSTGRLTYVNSSLTSFTDTGGYPTTTVTTAGGVFANDIFYIGCRGGTVGFFNGSISSLKIYGFKIDPTQIAQNFNATKARFNL
jgi:hypothetical protein